MTCRCLVRWTTGAGCLLTGGRGHASVAVFQKVHWHGGGLSLYMHAARQLTVHAQYLQSSTQWPSQTKEGRRSADLAQYLKAPCFAMTMRRIGRFFWVWSFVCCIDAKSMDHVSS